MSKPTTKTEFQDYALRKLGAPLLRINVDATQMDDALDDALELFYQYHYEGTTESYFMKDLTQEEIDGSYISMPDDCQSISEVRSSSFTSMNPTDIQVRMYLSDVIRNTIGGQGGVGGYYMMMQRLAELEHAFKYNVVSSFSFVQGKVFVHTGFGDLVAGSSVILFGKFRTNPVVFSKVWNDPWLKKYYTALIKKQWATNLQKFAGIQLVGGVALNADTLMQQAETEIQTLTDELYNNYSEPVLFFMG